MVLRNLNVVKVMITRRDLFAKGLPLLLMGYSVRPIKVSASSDVDLYRLQIELSNPTADFITKPFFKVYLPMTIDNRQYLVDAHSDTEFGFDRLRSGHNILRVELDKIEPWNTVILNFMLSMRFSLPYPTDLAISTHLSDNSNSLFSIVSENDKLLLSSTAQLLKARSDTDTLKNTFEWVINNFKPSNYNAGFLTIDKLWENKSGDCSEFALLTSNLLRMNGIASRTMAGFLLNDNKVLSMKLYHNWCECLVDGQWLIADAYTQTLADSAPTHLATQVYEIDDNEIHQAKFVVSDGVKVRI